LSAKATDGDFDSSTDRMSDLNESFGSIVFLDDDLEGLRDCLGQTECTYDFSESDSNIEAVDPEDTGEDPPKSVTHQPEEAMSWEIAATAAAALGHFAPQNERKRREGYMNDDEIAKLVDTSIEISDSPEGHHGLSGMAQRLDDRTHKAPSAAIPSDKEGILYSNHRHNTIEIESQSGSPSTPTLPQSTASPPSTVPSSISQQLNSSVSASQSSA